MLCFALLCYANLRDERVDQWINDARNADDPMADVQQEGKLHGNARVQQFNKSLVPPLVTIVVDAFVTPEGERVPQHSVELVTTPDRRALVTMVINEANLGWLVKAATLPWDAKFVTKKRAYEIDFNDLPPLDAPLSYKFDNRDNLQICGKYRCANGRWKRTVKTLTPWDVNNESMQELVIRSFETQMLEFIKEHHHAPDEPDPNK